MSDYWTDYWQHGHLTSFGDVFAKNYPAVLSEGWKSWAKELETPVVLVDIATGNGALIDLVSECVAVGTQMIGVDAAKLSVPEKLKSLPYVQFIDETKVESLPFKDSEASAAMSQFGLEYANLKQAVPELLRVLNDNGAFRFITHIEDSLILRPNKQILNVVDLILERNGIAEKLAKLLKALSKFGPGSTGAEKARKQLNDKLSGLLEKCSDEGIQGTNLQKFLQDVMKPMATDKQKEEMLTAYKEEMSQLQQRLADLCGAALSKTQINDLIEQLTQSDCVVKKSEPVVTEDGSVLGWLIEGQKVAV